MPLTWRPRVCVPSVSAFNILASRAHWLAFAAVVLAFVLRLELSSVLSFHPDEVMHTQTAREPTLLETLQSARQHSHPPLSFLAFHLVSRAASSEVSWRLLPVLWGALCVWFLYRWVSAAFGAAAGLAAAYLAAVLPFLVHTTVEVRGYGLLHLLVAAAFDQATRLFDDGRLRRLYAGGALLAMAVLTHYGAVFAVAAFGVCTLAYYAVRRPPRSFCGHWVLVQVLIAGLFAALFVTHISGLRHSEMETYAKQRWLRAEFHDPQEGGIGRFLATNTWALLLNHYTRAPDRSAKFQTTLGDKAGLIVALAAGFLAIPAAYGRQPKFWALLASAAVAYGGAAAAAVAGLHPYGGTRHGGVLVMFSLPFAGALAALVARRRPAWAAVLLLLIGVYYAGVHRRLRTPLGRATIAELQSGLDQFRGKVAPGEWGVADHASALLLRHYLEPGTAPFRWRRLRHGVLAAQGGPYRLISSRPGQFGWAGRLEQFEETWAHARESVQFPSRVWVVASSPIGEKLAAGSRAVTEIQSAGAFEFFRLTW